MNKKTLYVLLLTLLFNVTLNVGAVESRWYSSKQVANGKQLFAQHCASCHGGEAESIPGWRKRDKDGFHPPPPLNGTAHTWHHPKKLLIKTIKEGGVRLGGKMPPFADKLKADEVEAVIAWFQSLWPDNIYQAWLDRGGLPKEPKKSALSASSKEKVVNNKDTKQPQSGLVLGELQSSPVQNIYQSKLGSRVIYVTKDGNYGFFGDLIDLKTGDNLTEKARQKERLDLLKGFASQEMVAYPAKGREKSHITVFTDTTCPFCRKLHAEVPALNKAGVSVRYIPFPRGGQRSQGYQDMRSVWCADNRQVAMDIAKQVKKGELGPGDCDSAIIVDKGYKLSVEMGLRGTPASILPDGTLIQGYRPTKKILELLNIGK